MSRLGGLSRTMPWTAGLFALGAIAVAGLPPLNGFVSELLVYLGLFDVNDEQGSNGMGQPCPPRSCSRWPVRMAMASFCKAGAMLFLGAPRTQAATQAHECGYWMRGPMLALARICAAIGLAPILFWPAVARAVASWRPAWAAVEPPAPLSTLGSASSSLGLLALTAAVSLWRKAYANGQRRGLTWDCGYAAPTARMQYTSGSFAGIASGWFVWVLQPERKLRRPRGHFPAEAIRLERIPETVLERIITTGKPGQPASIQRGAPLAARTFAILHSLCAGGTVALGIFVIFGGMP